MESVSLAEHFCWGRTRIVSAFLTNFKKVSCPQNLGSWRSHATSQDVRAAAVLGSQGPKGRLCGPFSRLDAPQVPFQELQKNRRNKFIPLSDTTWLSRTGSCPSPTTPPMSSSASGRPHTAQCCQCKERQGCVWRKEEGASRPGPVELIPAALPASSLRLVSQPVLSGESLPAFSHAAPLLFSLLVRSSYPRSGRAPSIP